VWRRPRLRLISVHLCGPFERCSLRLVITGASGFFGRHLVPASVRRGHNVRAIVRQPVEFQGAQTVQIPDIAADVDWMAHLDGAHAVVHLAALAHATSHISEAEYHRVNTVAAVKLAKAASQSGSRFIFISSIAAQTGPSSSQELTEDDAQMPTTAYGRSKLMAEREIAALGSRYVILRPTLTYGAAVRGNMDRILRLSLIRIAPPLAAVKNRRSLLAIENLCDAVEFALTSDAALEQVYLVADAFPISIAEIVENIRKGAGLRGKGLAIPSSLLSVFLRSCGLAETWEKLGGDLVASVQKLRSHGFRWRIDTATALQRLGALSVGKPWTDGNLSNVGSQS
jgi:nucleoside-diphosphate-sugar epimerase